MRLADELAKYHRFASDVRDFFKKPTTLHESKELVRRRLAERHRNFVQTLSRTVFGHPESPYRALLKHAGASLEDVRGLVERVGLESALQQLQQAGVRITYEEYKGLSAISRGSLTFCPAPYAFDNPLAQAGLRVSSGGSSGRSTSTILDLQALAARVCYMALAFSEHGCADAPAALWLPVLPGAAGIRFVLQAGKLRHPLERWFSHVNHSTAVSRLKHVLRTNAAVWLARRHGDHAPYPEHVGFADISPIVDWVADTLATHGKCLVSTYVSSAVRICHEAQRSGISLEGARFLVGGEPLSETRRSEMESAGARVMPGYFITEAGFIGCGCSSPASADEVHVFTDMFAIIQRERELPHTGQLVHPFLFTTLLATAPRILLNVEMDDYGETYGRECGCEFGRLGFRSCISNIRSFSKFTAQGMSLSGADVVELMEKALPSEFGGSSADYQLLERDDGNGGRRIELLVSRRVANLDSERIKRFVLRALEKQGDVHRLYADIWRQSGSLGVVRGEPLLTPAGKVFPYRVMHETSSKSQRADPAWRKGGTG